MLGNARKIEIMESVLIVKQGDSDAFLDTISNMDSLSGYTAKMYIEDSAGPGTANFSATIRGLVKSTTYHARAYVTNETGTTYGADKEVTTYSQSIALDDSGNAIVDDDGNVIIIN